MKRINSYMLIQWILFIPLLLPLSIVSGALDGMRKILIQAKSDVIEQNEVTI